MSDYRAVQEALAKGTDPAMLCATCPWDRYCVTAPAMTARQVEQHIAEARAKDDADAAEKRARGEDAGLPVGSLLTVLAIGGRDLTAQVCPVLSVRLRSSDGRKIADAIKSQMQGWEES